MLRAVSLRAKIICIFSAIAVVALAGGGSLFWYTYQTDRSIGRMVDREIFLYKAAQDMELALANQKGFLTYYLVDGDEKWLTALTSYRRIFSESLERAASLDLMPEDRQALEIIAGRYAEYIKAKDLAIDNYRRGIQPDLISSPHVQQRNAFFQLLGLCREFSQKQWQEILKAEEVGIRRSQSMRLTGLTGLTAFVGLCILFLAILYRQILVPIRGLAVETGGFPRDNLKNEVDSLAHSLQGMLRDFDETSDKLAKSQRTLMQAERMATVGELAAGVAHTIRNPFTSIKMRMFSLGRSLDLSEAQNEDLQVIGEEIARIDKIVQNFLEFARPPKLRLANCYLKDVIRSVLVLLDYRLRKYEVQLCYEPREELPAVQADADRLKEALVNLIVNSCEAMGHGGRITLEESRAIDPQLGEVAVLSVKDTGPGVPEAILDKITTPFFSTKEEGSGIGLSIVARIVQEHDGKFLISSEPGEGTECLIYLPVAGRVHEYDSDH